MVRFLFSFILSLQLVFLPQKSEAYRIWHLTLEDWVFVVKDTLVETGKDLREDFGLKHVDDASQSFFERMVGVKERSIKGFAGDVYQGIIGLGSFWGAQEYDKCLRKTSGQVYSFVLDRSRLRQFGDGILKSMYAGQMSQYGHYDEGIDELMHEGYDDVKTALWSYRRNFSRELDFGQYVAGVGNCLIGLISTVAGKSLGTSIRNAARSRALRNAFVRGDLNGEQVKVAINKMGGGGAGPVLSKLQKSEVYRSAYHFMSSRNVFLTTETRSQLVKLLDQGVLWHSMAAFAKFCANRIGAAKERNHETFGFWGDVLFCRGSVKSHVRQFLTISIESMMPEGERSKRGQEFRDGIQMSKNDVRRFVQSVLGTGKQFEAAEFLDAVEKGRVQPDKGISEAEFDEIFDQVVSYLEASGRSDFDWEADYIVKVEERNGVSYITFEETLPSS